jgi:chemotaxis protein MotB
MADELINQVILLSSSDEDESPPHSTSWKVALADMMTAMFGVFLVLWLLASTTPAGRAEIASVFKYPSITPKELGRTENKDTKETTGTSASIIKKNGGRNSSRAYNKAKAKGTDDKHRPIQDVHKALVAKLKKQLGDDVNIAFKNNEVVITIKGDTLYPPGSFQASPKDEEIILNIADVLVNSNQAISIEGHTDNGMVNSELIKSNYELSALRSARIAWIFNIVGVNGTRITPKGLGQNFPISDNSTPEGRSNNRRVIIKIKDKSIFENYENLGLEIKNP